MKVKAEAADGRRSFNVAVVLDLCFYLDWQSDVLVIMTDWIDLYARWCKERTSGIELVLTEKCNWDQAGINTMEVVAK